MDFVAEIIDLFAPTAVYGATYSAASYVAGFVTPILLIIAVYVRTLEAQTQAITGQSRWAMALKDMGVWMTVLAIYFGLGAYIVDLFNAFYGAFSKQGSLSVVMEQFQSIMSEIKERKAEASFIEAAGNMLTEPFAWITFFIYFLSLLVLTALTIFLRFALAFSFALAFIWGLIAIPISITQSMKLLRGWAVLLGGVLLWPIIESLLLAFFIPVFAEVSKYLVANAGHLVADDQAAVFFLFSVLNLVIIAILIAAPFVAAQLVLNSSSLYGMVSPFVGASLAAGASAAKSFAFVPRGMGGSIGAAMRESATGQMMGESIKSKFGGSGGASTKFGVSTAKHQSMNMGSAANAVTGMANASQNTSSTASNKESTTDTGTATATASAQSRQQRRGAVLDRLHKKGKITLSQRGKN